MIIKNIFCVPFAPSKSAASTKLGDTERNPAIQNGIDPANPKIDVNIKEIKAVDWLSASKNLNGSTFVGSSPIIVVYNVLSKP